MSEEPTRPARGGHVVVAPDKFKGSLTAREVADHVAAGLRAAVPGLDVRRTPVADGGDGTLDAVVTTGFTRAPVTAEGPTGEPVEASFAMRGGAADDGPGGGAGDGTAVVEMAEVSGLRRLPGGVLAPRTASSYGTGQALRAALDAGCQRIVLGIGGSASTDGGAGLVQALGARVLDAAGNEVARGGAALLDVDRLDLSGLDSRLADTEIVVACDVDNPLLGPQGAAAVYGPQKGASAQDVALLDRALARWADVVRAATGRDVASAAGAGAAGGVGFAALALLGARLEPGIALMLDLVDFPVHLAGARLVVTGEGSLDEQSLRGKAPVGVATAAARAGVPVVAVAGRTTLSPAALHEVGIAAAYSLQEIEPDLQRSMSGAGALLEKLGRRIAEDWLR